MEKKETGIIYDNSQASEIPMLELTKSKIVEGQIIESIHLLSRSITIEEALEGMEYLIKRYKKIK